MDINENEILLIRAFKNGDQKAFEKLFERYHKKLYAYLMRLLDSKEDAEEIVQESFIKIWEKREEFIEGYSFDAFLFKIAKNTFLNFTREKVNRRVFEDHFQLINEVESGKTDDYVIFKETREIIRLIIEGMPPRRREVFMMRKVEGLSRKEISEKLGISVITVDSQLLKANTYLKDELKKYGLLLICLLAG
ncbi:RNA polymerase sigma factor [Anaerorudis cellulosivorans]|uniref:RNA polymerase sigma factor n=1 Tax=Anaerorudis cellulosivorans TaxID=3397862 RepID=UPI00221E9C3D|nr:RNA polymerase sigma-70 factor [Seramator thermalis]MCW1734359.1 RNA polymerase sigma-70 factor [Seramator thermalis]